MRNWKNRQSFESHFFTHRWLFLFFLGWIWYFISFWSRALFINENGGLSAGHVNIWGDWAAHFTMGSQIAARSNWLSSGPFLISEPLRYPFVADWVSAQIVALGGSLQLAYVLPSLVTSLFLVGIVWWCYKQWFNSTVAASVALSIFLWNGGIGFVYFIQEVLSSTQPLVAFLNPTHEYTRIDDQAIKWINVIDSMIIPQRAFTLGFPVAVLALTIVYQLFVASSKPKIWTNKEWLKASVAGLLFGLLPILHTHSFLASFIIVGCWFIGQFLLSLLINKASTKLLKNELLRWLAVILPSGSLASFIIFTVFTETVTNQSFFQYLPGWLATTYQQNWLWWWFKNWSITPFLATGFWLYQLISEIPKKRVQIFFFYLPFFILFILANLYLFQPFAWDNTKIFVWSSFGFAALVTTALAKLWTKIYLKPVAICFAFLIVVSGMIDSFWIQRTELHSFEMYSAEELELAAWVRSTTPTAVWLTGDQHNHWLFNLTGNQSIITYRGWLWTHGYSYLPQESDVSLLFTQPNKNIELFKKYNIQYVVIGPNEITTWHADQNWFKHNFVLLKSSLNYAIYQVTIE